MVCKKIHKKQSKTNKFLGDLTSKKMAKRAEKTQKCIKISYEKKTLNRRYRKKRDHCQLTGKNR